MEAIQNSPSPSANNYLNYTPYSCQTTCPHCGKSSQVSIRPFFFPPFGGFHPFFGFPFFGSPFFAFPFVFPLEAKQTQPQLPPS